MTGDPSANPPRAALRCAARCCAASASRSTIHPTASGRTRSPRTSTTCGRSSPIDPGRPAARLLSVPDREPRDPVGTGLRSDDAARLHRRPRRVRHRARGAGAWRCRGVVIRCSHRHACDRAVPLHVHRHRARPARRWPSATSSTGSRARRGTRSSTTAARSVFALRDCGQQRLRAAARDIGHGANVLRRRRVRRVFRWARSATSAWRSAVRRWPSPMRS